MHPSRQRAEIAALLLVLLAAGPSAGHAQTKDKPMLSEQSIDQRIAKHRTAEVTLTVRGPNGEPLADREVVVRMVRHKFRFGCNIFALRPDSQDPLDTAYGERFADLLNFATLPFYWRSYEKTQGDTRAEQITAMARWCKAHGIGTKGHPLVWTLEPAWVGQLDPARGETLLFGRIGREIRGFKGQIDAWDVLNEAVVGIEQARRRDARVLLRLYERDGRLAVIQRAFAEARKANPTATLILNDFRTDEAYEKVVADALAADVPIDVIGIQSHMHGGYWGAAKAWEVCERFARFGKPLHFTELTILSGQAVGKIDWERNDHNRWTTSPELERQQAQHAAEFYRVLFSHPAVGAITWWDFSDRRSWMGAPAGLVRADMTPKPAYDALRKLIRKDWWTGPLTLRTDADGRVRFRGYLGGYQVAAGDAEATFDVPEAGSVTTGANLAPAG